MSTVAPSKIKEFTPESLEKIVYKSVETIPTREPNDQYRLGYSVWQLVTEKKGTLQSAVHQSGARMLIPEADVIRTIAAALKQSGISVE
ncbi:MAG: hypothetical protein NTV54_02625 [Ignavibacteriales bacterium]|nr:hypothetical protein [Ignavibacteriales bacterium]